MFSMEQLMEQTPGLAGIVIMAAISVAVGFTSAGYAGPFTAGKSGEAANLLDSLAGILGLDRVQVDRFVRELIESSPPGRQSGRPL